MLRDMPSGTGRLCRFQPVPPFRIPSFPSLRLLVLRSSCFVFFFSLSLSKFELLGLVRFNIRHGLYCGSTPS